VRLLHLHQQPPHLLPHCSTQRSKRVQWPAVMVRAGGQRGRGAGAWAQKGGLGSKQHAAVAVPAASCPHLPLA
jgi:hypothetical protein